LIFSFYILNSNSLYGSETDEFAKSVIQEYKELLNKKYILIPYEDSYVLPFSYNDNPNNKAYESILENQQVQDRGKFVLPTETQFKLSFLILTNENFLGTNFNTFIGYTHQAWWQVYNTGWSRPFRENNYRPEFFARRLFEDPRKIGPLNLLAYDFGIVHHSNGQIQELSKSWNRVFFRYNLIWGRLVISHRIWWRIPEKSSNDDNPDILKYMGYNDLNIIYNAGNNHYQLKLNLGEKYHGVELSYSYPWKEGLRFFTKIYHGYGASLIDYDHETRSLSFGVSLDNPFTAKAKKIEENKTETTQQEESPSES
jgi:phospholipase A1